MKTNWRTLSLMGMVLMASATAHAQNSAQHGQHHAHHDRSLVERVSALEAQNAALSAQLAASVTCPARSKPTDPRFTDMGDGTICDGDTGLMWEKKLAADDVGGNCSAPVQADRSIRCVNNSYTWRATGTEPDGTLFTDFLARKNQGESISADGGSITQAGYTDWRIPNIVELRGIIDTTADGCGSGTACINPIFGPMQASNYWSSSSQPGNPINVWFVGFYDGINVNVISKDLGNFLPIYARAVRGGR